MVSDEPLAFLLLEGERTEARTEEAEDEKEDEVESFNTVDACGSLARLSDCAFSLFVYPCPFSFRFSCAVIIWACLNGVGHRISYFGSVDMADGGFEHREWRGLVIVSAAVIAGVFEFEIR